jgi:oligoribonuclease (3'-5' exoribonuclease)
MDDIKESVRELQFYRDKLFVTEVVSKNSQA